MALPKTPHIYKAIARAIDAFGEAHGVTGRQHFAPLLGFRGENASVQLSSHLNYTTHNPTTPKPLSVDHVARLLDEMGPHASIIMDALAKSAGGVFVLEADAAVGRESVRDELLEIAALTGDLSNCFLQFKQNDGVIDEEEAAELKRVAYEARAALKAFERMIAQDREK